jgi:hypothetical protein
MVANANDLRDHRGHYFDHWRRQCLAAFGVVLEEPPANE